MNEADVFKALADPTRLKILECIRKGEKCICEIIPYTGKSQPNVSQHLKVLKNAGIVDERKDGTRIIIKVSKNEIYTIVDKVKDIFEK
ncbi:MAG TPA: metalloregulator ArsR/SmtB family transcription factor [Candidatus Thermoplasmatota archaeon]|nr:metalloregulator ArsR/SmtB family transcription factor [Candidatus Thermoplasmatota archaeon]HUU87809.1 metalloregulator ArsR/SmtB family transcription factor [Candidatus Glassbacteria bacterium]